MQHETYQLLYPHKVCSKRVFTIGTPPLHNLYDTMRYIVQTKTHNIAHYIIQFSTI